MMTDYLSKPKNRQKSFTPLEVLESKGGHKESRPLTGFTPLEITRSKSKCKKSKSLTGFTLIELLVVMAIIALFLGISGVGLTIVKAKSRDAQRKQNLDVLRKAMQIYRTSHDSYPVMDCIESPSWNCWGEPSWTCADHPNSLQCYLVEGEYIQRMPRDMQFYDDGHPCSVPTDSYGYAYCSNGSQYFFCARLETEGISQASRPCCTEFCNYFIGDWFPMPPSE